MRIRLSLLTAAVCLATGLAGLGGGAADAFADVKRAYFKSRTNYSAERPVRRLARRSRLSVSSHAKRKTRRTSRAYPRHRRAGMTACRSAARRFGVPVSTAMAVCRLESGFRCSAVGRAGELGLLQIKLSTARALGYRGSRRGLLSCGTGAYWGMKHLALAIRRGGVWKHNQGLFARRPTASARAYARKVAALRRQYR